MSLFYALFAALGISALSLVGVFTLILQRQRLRAILHGLIALSAGTLLGGSFFHLLPEALELLPVQSVLTVTLLSFISFLFIEKFIAWRHCHKVDCEVHSLGYMNLLGDALHNFIDGLVLAASFQINPGLGLATTVAIAAHEIPQELGDFGVLLHAGFKRGQALFFNFLSASFAIAGVLLGTLAIGQSATLSLWLLPVAAGSFLYIAASDLLPEIRDEAKLSRVALSMLIFLAGILLMWSLSQGDSHSHAHSAENGSAHGEYEYHEHGVENDHDDTLGHSEDLPHTEDHHEDESVDEEHVEDEYEGVDEPTEHEDHGDHEDHGEHGDEAQELR